MNRTHLVADLRTAGSGQLVPLGIRVDAFLFERIGSLLPFQVTALLFVHFAGRSLFLVGRVCSALVGVGAEVPVLHILPVGCTGFDGIEPVIDVDVVIAIDLDINVVTMPVRTAPDGIGNTYAYTEADTAGEAY